MSGFSLTKFLLIFVAIAILVGGGLTATYFVLKQQQTSSAQLFMQSFIDEVEKNDAQSTFKSFSTSLKTNDQQASYYSWLFWMAAFNTDTNKVTITQPAESITYKDASLFNVLGSKEAIIFIYTTSGNSKISFQAVKSSDEWVLSNYAAL